MNRRRIIIVDDHPLFRAALRQTLVGGDPSIVIEEAGDLAVRGHQGGRGVHAQERVRVDLAGSGEGRGGRGPFHLEADAETCCLC